MRFVFQNLMPPTPRWKGMPSNRAFGIRYAHLVRGDKAIYTLLPQPPPLAVWMRISSPGMITQPLTKE